MRLPSHPLTEIEEAELRDLLAEAKGAPLEYARGIFAAVTTAPTAVEVTDWLGEVVGADVRDRDTLRRTVALLMRDLSACAQCLELGVPAVPAPEAIHAIRNFCKGYVKVSQRDQRWKSSFDALQLTLPLAALAEYLSDDAAMTLWLGVGLSKEPWLQQQREELSQRLVLLHGHFSAARESNAVAAATTFAKPTRNEACPCGSGKKFKRCCGSN